MSTPNISSPAPTTQPAHQEETLSSVTGPEGGYRYPEQKHTGAVGLGPNYGRGAVSTRVVVWKSRVNTQFYRVHMRGSKA